jgi:hypothetical protein
LKSPLGIIVAVRRLSSFSPSHFMSLYAFPTDAAYDDRDQRLNCTLVIVGYPKGGTERYEGLPFASQHAVADRDVAQDGASSPYQLIAVALALWAHHFNRAPSATPPQRGT